MEVAWRAFIRDMKHPFFFNMVNQEKSYQGNKPVLALAVFINIRINGGSYSCGGSGGNRMTITMR